jgi:serine protease AprX
MSAPFQLRPRQQLTLPSLCALSLPLCLSALATGQSGGQVTPYGCLNPPGSLVHSGGQASPGQALLLGVTDPTASFAAGSLAFLQIHAAPAPGFPCGVPLPGFGLSGGVGELLFAPGATAIYSAAPQAWNGTTPANFSLLFPGNPNLAGLSLYAQGALFGQGKIGLTNGQHIVIGPVGLPNLVVRAVSAAPLPVAPGETSTLSVVVENTSTVGSAATGLQLTSNTGYSANIQVPALAPGQRLLLTRPFNATTGHQNQNPHWFTATIDPNGTQQELSETDNQRTGHKPLFVVEPILVSPSPVNDHDETLWVAGGQVLDFQRVEYGSAGAPSQKDLPADTLKGQINPENGKLEVLGQGPAEDPKVHPELIAAEQALEAGQKLEYVVQYRHNIPMPRLPDLKGDLPRFAPQNLANLELRMAMFEGVKRARRQSMTSLKGQIEEQGGTVLETYALAGACLVRGPKGLLQMLNGHPQVERVERVVEPESTPPGNVADGRDLIGSDAYYDDGATGVGFSALLDSGVRTSHTLFTGVDHIDFLEDCFDGNSDCNDDGDPSYNADDVDNHGTSTAAIFTGNNDLGDGFRGISAGMLDSWKVYNDAGFLDTTAVHRGFDQAVLWGDKIIIAEMQSGQDHKGSIADDADDAYDAGHCVIAANGNNGSASGTVNSPASAHKAIGVGAYDVDSLANQSYVSRGPTPDDRYKPDLQAPTNTSTADTASSTATNGFGGTSGATPYAAGAASVWADWFGQASLTSADSGKVYAALINSGPNDWDTPFGNQEGVGPFELPQGGTYYAGSRTVANGESKFVTIDVPVGCTEISAAIWWPEGAGNTHRDIDLYLLKPDGSVSDSSISVPSVFEHVRVFEPITSGTRQVEIRGYDVPWLVNQTVYFSIFVKY